MRSPIAFAPRPGPLSNAGALAPTVFLGSFALVAFAYSSPIVLVGCGVAVVVAGFAAGAGRPLAAALRWGLVLGVLVVAVNALVSQRGETILVRGGQIPLLGQIDVSAEALAEGGVLALRIAIVFAVFAVHSACVDPDRVLRLLRPLARHSALTATLIARLVPLASADHARLREATSLRGPAAAPVGRAVLAQRLVAGSLDRAVDVAAALELRGYAGDAPRSARTARREPYAARFAIAGMVVSALAIVGSFAGIGSFDPYPTMRVAADTATLLFAGTLPMIAAVPFLRPARRWRMRNG